MAAATIPAIQRVRLTGLPVYSGALLTADAPVFPTLRTVPDYVRFAKELRGQFCIIVETGAETFAITDFGCSRPVFYLWDAARNVFRVSSNLAELTPHTSGRFNPAALFFHADRGGIGIDPFYDDAKGLFAATVTRFHGSQTDSVSYLDWGEFLETRPIAPAAAEEAFIGIASEYLGAVLRDTGRVGCLLSGGVDSALMAWLLKKMGKDVLCLTADYQWKRYSEFADARRNAGDIGVRQERVLITRGKHHEAFRQVNSGRQNAPCAHSQSPGLYWLARHAAASGIDRLVTGDHADALFLGFDHFFRGFPQDHDGYASAIAAMDPAAKVARLFSKPGLRSSQEELLAAFGCNARQCLDWQMKLYNGDCRDRARWAESTALPVLQQLDGQIWAGIPWQNIFLPVTLACEGNSEFVSPFYDLAMIKFALSLPVEYKFGDGVTKVLVRSVLARVLKRSIVKRASPNPSRVWSLLPSLADRRAITPRLRPLFDRLCLRNLRQSGRLCGQIDKTAALGIWLSSQRLSLQL